ncbi:MAG TPA: ImmA/IrrE family metallo-endopeptidase [Pseudobacteroides sp.]|uniref:ImmA/IrrE family metallo-endopeptidase n=1 Tax=Pseudobacteroides sp. TaxID=1968840 RepID=UPI002F930D83
MEKVLNKIITDYSQEKYDFKPDKLSNDDIDEIKKISREKRYDYGNAPIGINIFKFIRDKEKNIFFEGDNFNSNFDAVIYLPDKNSELAFIILNKSKPLVNQIFAAAHEYYHYLKDIEDIKREPIICSLANSNIKREQKASRFAAEFLLPEEALRNEFKRLCNIFKSDNNDTNFIAILCYVLSINYGLPLKATIYRLYEEGYLKDIKVYVNNYDFFKKSLSEIFRRYTDQGQELLSPGNKHIEEVMYDYIPKAYEKGYISYDKLLYDVNTLLLDINNFGIKSPYDESEDDSEINELELIEKLKKKLIR